MWLKIVSDSTILQSLRIYKNARINEFPIVKYMIFIIFKYLNEIYKIQFPSQNSL